ncbi:MAG: hypothetical protein MRECE_2c124 [Mycoplasmataceae bacterium CE_OT135]|nr:MAG: hypothetical protein MRECE_2c124 [Mycoplasmataceae bacterium CE_OT135]
MKREIEKVWWKELCTGITLGYFVLPVGIAILLALIKGGKE